MLKSRKDWEQTIRQSILSNDKAALKALDVIYSFQTSDEQAAEATRNHNHVGFSPMHAQILSSFHTQYRSRGYLSEKQMEILRKYMVHYSRQLFDNAVSQGKYVKSGRQYEAQ